MKRVGSPKTTAYIKTLRVLGVVLFPAAWLIIKYGFSVSDKFLPGPVDVFQSAFDLSPSIISHFAASAMRLGSGVVLGALFGIPLGAILYVNRSLRELLTPTLISMQNVPPLAVVPFFILWFGFSELGKFLIVFLSVAVNLAMYGVRALNGLEPRYRTMIKSYGLNRLSALRLFFVPYILSVCLPTLRYVLSVSVGLVLFSELLGAQVGLGYLIQTARSTFSMSLVFLVALISTVLYVLFDAALVAFWRRAFPWSVS
jgi:sulfonate transport system permease protein